MSKKYKIEEWDDKREKYVIVYLRDMPWARARIERGSYAYIKTRRNFSQLGTCWETFGEELMVFGDSCGFHCGKWIGQKTKISHELTFSNKLFRFVRS